MSERNSTKSMPDKYRRYLTRFLSIPIIVNDDLTCRLMYYDQEKKYQSRQLKHDDNAGILEWCSYPWYDKKKSEWICVGLYNDENVILALNPFVIMQYFAFYRHY